MQVPVLVFLYKQKAAYEMKGVYERIPGSGIWWIRYADENGKERREKVGSKRNAEALYRKRKTTVLAGPQSLTTALRGFSCEVSIGCCPSDREL